MIRCEFPSVKYCSNTGALELKNISIDRLDQRQCAMVAKGEEGEC